MENQVLKTGKNNQNSGNQHHRPGHAQNQVVGTALNITMSCLAQLSQSRDNGNFATSATGNLIATAPLSASLTFVESLASVSGFCF